MLRLLRFLITGDWHLHQWERRERIKISDADNPDGRSIAVKHICECKVCRAWKAFEV